LTFSYRIILNVLSISIENDGESYMICDRSLGLFVSASGSFWSPKAAADCQTLSFLASFYKIRWSKNHPKSTYTHNRLSRCNSRIRHFLDPEPYEQLYFPPHVIVMILRFFSQPDSPYSQIFRKAGQKKS
jgi:hypothetical protein